MSEKKKIAIFGGTFDPIHNGHLKMAINAKEQYKLDEVYFLTAKEPPHKDSVKLDAEKRYSLVEKALSDIQGFKTSRLELDREGLSYSHETVKAFKEKFAEAELFWILGSDEYLKLDTWKNFEYLKESIAFLICFRPEDFDVDEMLSFRTKHKLNAHIVLMKPIDISSTSIRDLVKSGENKLLEELVPLTIKDEVLKLYS